MPLPLPTLRSPLDAHHPDSNRTLVHRPRLQAQGRGQPPPQAPAAELQVFKSTALDSTRIANRTVSCT